MTDYSITLPAYTIGTRAYDKIFTVCSERGQHPVIIGGKRALAAAEKAIRKAMAPLSAPESIWYGGEASEENIASLSAMPVVQTADMIFAVGGGKALDTCKALGQRMGKPVFTFPTIASTCAATTAVSILYHPDGTFSAPCFLTQPPAHAFLDTGVIAAAPEKYLWAGLGDTYAKYYESTVSSRGEVLEHYHELGVTVSRMCVEPILRWGQAALADNRSKTASYELEQVVLAVVVTTGIASILLTAEHIIDYNTGLAHAIFYALTAYPQIEKNHLHGEVVGFGVLILLLADGQDAEFERLYSFMKSVGLPVTSADIELSEEEVRRVIPQVCQMHDIDHNPYPVTPELLTEAFDKLAEYGRGRF